MTHAEMAERDARVRLEAGAVDPSISSPCPCGKDVVEAETKREEDIKTGRVLLHLFYHHPRYQTCHFIRKF